MPESRDELPSAYDPRKRNRAKMSPSAQVLLQNLRADPPGQPSDNRLQQSQHYKGVIYVAIKALVDAISAATIKVTKKRLQHSGLLKRGTVTKAMPTPGTMPDDQDQETITDKRHSLVQLIDMPNKQDTFADLLTDLIIQNALTGTGLLWANPDQNNLPAELYVLPTALCWPQPISPEYPKGSWLVTQYYQSGIFGNVPSAVTGAGARVDGRDIWRFKNRHVLWRWDGYSPLTAGQVQLDILEAVDLARWAAMDTGLTPDAVLLAPGLDQQQLNSVLSSIQQTSAGRRNHRKILGLGGGTDDAKFDLKFPNTTAKDMDFSSGWEQMVSFALALFGVPKSIAGLSSATSYAELYAGLKQFHTLTLMPLAAKLGAFFTMHLARLWGDDLAIQIELPTINNEEQDAERFNSDCANSLVTYNEARMKRGYPPVEGGDVLLPIYTESMKAKAQAKTQQEIQASMPQPPAQPGAAAPAQMDPASTNAIAAIMGKGGDDGGDDEGTQALAALMGKGGGSGDGPPSIPQPENEDGEGSLPPRQEKSLHQYGCAFVPLDGAAANRLLALGRSIPRGDLSYDGCEDEPHVTCLLGLHESDPEPVREAVKNSGQVTLRLGKIGVFKSEEHDVLFVEVDSPDIHSIHRGLCKLPHTKTHPNYKPHATICYLKPGLGEKHAKRIGAVNMDCCARELVFSDCDKHQTVIPLGMKVGTVEKAMSALTDTAGGALVAPPQMAGKVIPLKRPTFKKKKRLRALVSHCKAVLGDEEPTWREPETDDVGAAVDSILAELTSGS